MKSNRSVHMPMVLIHVLIWVIVFCMPFFAWDRSDGAMRWDRYLHFAVTPLMFMGIFYLNYCLLVDKLLFRRKTLAYLLVNMAVITVAVLFLYYWQRYASPVKGFGLIMRPGMPEGIGPPMPARRPGPLLLLMRDGTMLLLMAGVALAVKMTMQWFRTEREKQALEAVRVEAELKNLKNQLNPHFLFNTLNNIYALIESDPAKARYAMESLSCMLRHILYDDNAREVALDHELEFIRSYIELMTLRLPENAVLEVDIPRDGKGLKIAPLMFINAVENAFKHGLSSKKPSFISIKIEIERMNAVSCTVENSSYPKTGIADGSGIGQENQAKRLELLYPGRYEERKGERNGTYSYFLRLYV